VNSIRRQLTVTLCLAAALLLPLGGLCVYLLVKQVLLSQFDATLAAKAQALIAAAEVDDKEFEFDLDVQRFAGFGSFYDGDFFEVRRSDGEVVARSPSLAGPRRVAWRDRVAGRVGRPRPRAAFCPG
jgi:two-component system sensor histidine kinase QseC